MTKLRVLDLFSGIGGFSLGLERTGGFETVAFCEIEPFPRKVLSKHWPEVPIYDDVRTLTADRLAADGIAVDAICGGFPCQDISFAGRGAGLAGERSGLFYEVARLVGELGPRYVVLENVGALLSRGLDAVLGTLASLGYDAEWHCIPASAVGAPHRRDRVWIVAYPCHAGHGADNGLDQDTGPQGPHQGEGDKRERVWPVIGRSGQALADTESDGRTKRRTRNEGRNADAARGVWLWVEPSGSGAGDGAQAVADTMRSGHAGQGQSFVASSQAPVINRQAIDAFAGSVGNVWRTEPDVGRVANGVPDRAHRLKGLGNAVVPQIPELIGRAILDNIAGAA